MLRTWRHAAILPHEQLRVLAGRGLVLVRPHPRRRTAGGPEPCAFCKQYVAWRGQYRPWDARRFQGVDGACDRCESECRNMLVDMRSLEGFSGRELSRKQAECDEMRRFAQYARTESERAKSQQFRSRANVALTVARATGDTRQIGRLLPAPDRKL